MNRYKEFEWMLQYRKMLDPINAKIVEELSQHGPRNIRSLAKSLGLPDRTIHFRFKKLINDGHLWTHADLNYSKLGLMKAVVLMEAFPGSKETLWKLIDNLGYWTFATKCYGKYDGYYVIFAFPAEHKVEFENYFAEAARLKIFSHHFFLWTGNPFEVPKSFHWFDFERRTWNFKWQQWIKDILNASEELSERLIDPKAYPIKVDKTDLLILKELEKNAFIDFKELADTVNLTPEGASYRYYNRILKQNLIVDYQIAIFPYPPQLSDMCSFIIEFKNERALAKFVNSRQNAPFLLSYAKVIGQNSLVVHTYTPKTEFSNLIESLNRLAEEKIIKNFFYVMLDILFYKRQTVSYEFFEDGAWTYDHEETLTALSKMVSRRPLTF